MISEDVFVSEMNSILKRRKIPAKTRREIIKTEILARTDTMDGILNTEEKKTAEFEKKQAEHKKIPSEFKEQCDFVKWFKSEFPGIVIMSIRNGGSRTPRERMEQLAEGLHPGAADLYIPKWKLWIEFKKIKGGVLSEKQKKFRDYVVKIGDNWMLAKGAKNGEEQILNFLKNKND